MPIIKSAKKRVRVAHKAAVRNSKTKRSLKSALKVFNAKPTSVAHSSAQSKIDTAVKKGIISKNKASRLKARAAAKAKTSNVKPAAAKKTTKTVTKTATTKKPTAAKKAPAKKPAVKRTTAGRASTKKS